MIESRLVQPDHPSITVADPEDIERVRVFERTTSILTAQTTFGPISCVHLSAIKYEPWHAPVHRQLFKDCAVVLGDFNSTWSRMIAQIDN
jgi:hypothetical protein